MNLGLVIKLDTKALTCRKDGWILNKGVFSEMHKVEHFSIDDVCEDNNNKISNKLPPVGVEPGTSSITV